MDFFQFYDMPITFLLNEKALKQKYYALSRQFHPDFYTLEAAAKQQEILEKSTFNSRAYKTLSDFDDRVKYILELKGYFKDGEKQNIPNDFLMEMMDINESVMDLQTDFDIEKHALTVAEVHQMQTDLYDGVKNILENYDDAKVESEDLKKVKEFYLKKRYLLRLEKNLATFAPL